MVLEALCGRQRGRQEWMDGGKGGSEPEHELGRARRRRRLQARTREGASVSCSVAHSV